MQQITAKNKRLRFLFAKSYKTWNEEWKNIVFSDEKKLILMDQMVTNDIGMTAVLHKSNPFREGQLVGVELWYGVRYRITEKWYYNK